MLRVRILRLTLEEPRMSGSRRKQATAQMRIPAVPTMHFDFDFQIKVVATDGTRLPIYGSGDFGVSPLLGQLSGKQSA